MHLCKQMCSNHIIQSKLDHLWITKTKNIQPILQKTSGQKSLLSNVEE